MAGLPSITIAVLSFILLPPEYCPVLLFKCFMNLKSIASFWHSFGITLGWTPRSKANNSDVSVPVSAPCRPTIILYKLSVRIFRIMPRMCTYHMHHRSKFSHHLWLLWMLYSFQLRDSFQLQILLLCPNWKVAFSFKWRTYAVYQIPLVATLDQVSLPLVQSVIE